VQRFAYPIASLISRMPAEGIRGIASRTWGDWGACAAGPAVGLHCRTDGRVCAGVRGRVRRGGHRADAGLQAAQYDDCRHRIAQPDPQPPGPERLRVDPADPGGRQPRAARRARARPAPIPGVATPASPPPSSPVAVTGTGTGTYECTGYSGID